MGKAPDPSSPAVPWWRPSIGQYIAPTVISTLVATVLSVYTAVNAAHEKQRDYNTKFEALVNGAAIKDAFGGWFVPNPKQSPYDRDRSKARFDQSVREQKAAATLLSLQSLAESETQRRTVLLIGARLLNADPRDPGAGGPAARLLTVLIDEADAGRHSLQWGERSTNERLWKTITSESFRDLVTSGYGSDYYNDDWDLASYSPTLNGDAPISSEAKFQVLWRITPERYEGWVHLATFAYDFPPNATPQIRPSTPPIAAQSAVTPQTARNFIRKMTAASINRDFSGRGQIVAQYAIADPRHKPPHDPLFDKAQLNDPKQYPDTWIMLKPRLLRSRPPVQYINPDGNFKKGSLGSILGVVPAGSCIVVSEPLEAALVILESKYTDPIAAKKKKPANHLTGRVHMWAHVHGSKQDAEACLASVNR